MKELENIINEKYYTFSLTEKSSIVIYLRPYENIEQRAGCVFISPYYIASNKAYKDTLHKIEKLKNFNARLDNSISIRSYLLRSGEFVLGKNCLAIDKELGSRFYICSFVIDLPTVSSGISHANSCQDCGKCYQICSNQALSEKFEVEKCLREIMNGYTHNEQILIKLNNKVLGCDDCQNVCPHNASVKNVGINESFYNETKLFNIIQNSYLGRKYLKSLEQFIGSNLIKPKRLLYYSINVATNLKDNSVLNLIEEINKNTNDDDLKFISSRYLKTIRGDV